MTSHVSVAEFYSGKSVFITGGTGFLGKALIEKLLYSCNDVNKIYVLVRAKKGVDAEKRIDEITANEAFSRIKQRNHKDLSKIVPMIGNITMENLGLTNDDLKTLIKEVSVVFHVAATVRLDEPLKKAVNINVNGTENTLKVCHCMEKLKALVHVSTMFCNSDKSDVYEIVYPAPHPVDHVRYMAEWYGDNEEVVKMLLGKRPNTYTYTKAIAEEVVKKQHKNIPTAIVRPSIVISSYSEPSPGWIDNWNGPTRLIAGVMTGFIRILFGNPKSFSDFIPVDFVTNSLIVAASKCEKSSSVKVYNSCTGITNTLTFQKQIDFVTDISKKHRMYKIPSPFTYYIKNRLLCQILVFFLHTLPAWCLDVGLMLTGQKPKYTRMQATGEKLMQLIKFVTCNEAWTFRDDHLRSAFLSLSNADRETFNFDTKTIDWETLLTTYCMGIKKYLMKETPMNEEKIK